jgi:DNA-directed RNA polymerase specialized sigma24 family protein
VAILEGAAAGCSHAEIAQGLEISKDLVEWRMREMRRICRERMAKSSSSRKKSLGTLPDFTF